MDRINPITQIDADGHCPWCVVFEEVAESPAGRQISVAAGAGWAALGGALGAAGGYILSHTGLSGPVAGIPNSATGRYAPATPGEIANQMARGKNGGQDNTSSGPKAADAAGVTAGGQATNKHGKKLGPSGKEQVNKTKSNTRERANNKAKNSGARTTEHRNPSDGGDPHFHPADESGEKKPGSTHHEYPR